MTYIYVIDKFDGEFSFLSNFYLCDVSYEGILYRSAEHAYQAAKTDDAALRTVIATAIRPGTAKRLGRGLVLQEDWYQIRYDIMYQIVLDKFLRNSLLRQKLIDTGYKHLIEGNLWGDTYWGVCNGKGQNKLGEILMKVREVI